MTQSAPGSLLISGEYRVTEPGGAGFAVAAGGRATLVSASSSSWELRGRWLSESVSWKPETKEDGSLAATVWFEFLKLQGGKGALPSRLEVDTSAFFTGEKSKRGYGSSAAAVLLFCSGIYPDHCLEDITSLAVRAHRAYQGGRGSGYDVLASAHGGVGQVTGGRDPSWLNLSWPIGIESWIIQGPRPVDSRGALERFEDWRFSNPKIHGHWTAEMDRITQNLGRASSVEDFLKHLSEAARMGEQIGNLIGISAHPQLPKSLEAASSDGSRPGVVAKCLGAGNEAALLCVALGSLRLQEQQELNDWITQGRAELLCIETDGLRDEPDL